MIQTIKGKISEDQKEYYKQRGFLTTWNEKEDTTYIWEKGKEKKIW